MNAKIRMAEAASQWIKEIERIKAGKRQAEMNELIQKELKWKEEKSEEKSKFEPQETQCEGTI